MSNYRRFYVPGGTYFFTIVTYQRNPYFANPDNVNKLRQAVGTVKKEIPFNIIGAVILPDHLHFLLTLPAEDKNYSKRIGRIKTIFTKSFEAIMLYLILFLFLDKNIVKVMFGNDVFGNTL